MEVVAVEKVKCGEFIARLHNNYELDEAIENIYWGGGHDVARNLFNVVMVYANEKKVQLTDIPDFDYEKELWDIYTNAEKGLS